MDFYNKFSEHYDYIFPFQKPQYSFLKEAIKSQETVLDLACGTGNYIVELCKNLDISGIGIDLDGSMIEKAKDKSRDMDNIKLYEKNMLDIEGLAASFNMIYCIGNSLPHLVDIDHIEEMIDKIYNSLDADGRLILQTVNYDRKPVSLKTIENKDKNIIFYRNYNYKDDIVEFITLLKGPDFEVEGKVNLYPILSKELTDILTKVGFREVQLYGGFNREPFHSMDSGSLIALAKK